MILGALQAVHRRHLLTAAAAVAVAAAVMVWEILASLQNLQRLP